MPPRIPVRFPWASRSSIPSLNGFPSSFYLRAFSSTPTSFALGPQSPNYIEVPKPRQPTFSLKPRVKGHLPVPRDVFKTRSKLPKESDKFIAQSTQNAKAHKLPGPYSRDADYRLYKQRLAESRKQALREGVKELHERKVDTEAEFLSRIRRRGEEKRRLAMAPPRTVDVLTQTSVSKTVREFLENKLTSTSRSKITDARRAAYRKRMAKQQAVRQARLHDLYTNARQFIVNEEQLDEAIEKAFGTEDMPVRWNSKGAIDLNGDGVSPWNGPMPEGVGDMLQKLKGGEGVGLAKERVKKLAEELTGGKM